jgi:phospholipase/carboxylesterase
MSYQQATIQFNDVSALVVAPKHKVQASMIWLHGLGASGYDFAPAVTELGIPPELGVRFVFPHAPSRAVTLNNGFLMPAWYDIYGLKFGTREDAPGLARAARWVEEIIAHEHALGIPHERIIIGGFSQGGAVALQCVLRYQQRLGGLLALSTYLPLASTLTQEITSANLSIPIFVGHGEFDPLVPVSWTDYTMQQLQQLGYRPELHIYAMEHSVNQQEMHDIGQWIKRILDK